MQTENFRCCLLGAFWGACFAQESDFCSCMGALSLKFYRARVRNRTAKEIKGFYLLPKTLFWRGLLNGDVSLHSLVSLTLNFLFFNPSAESSILYTTLRPPLIKLTLMSKMDFSLRALFLISLWYLTLFLATSPSNSLLALIIKYYKVNQNPSPALASRRWVRTIAPWFWGCSSCSSPATSILRWPKTHFAFSDLISHCYRSKSYGREVLKFL